MRRKKFFPPLVSLLILYSILLFLSPSCRYYKLERELDPINADFLDKVRYIITKEERRIFLDLPGSEKEKFQEEFWKRRDPDPQTEENEFKMEYYDRIERATELFISDGRPGWLTDRGRIYVLFGPPMDRFTDPAGGYNCRETWYYGNFPIVFRDETCTGDYRLVTYDLTSLREFNLMYMHELNLAEYRAQQTITGESEIFYFDWDLDTKLVEPHRLEATVSFEVPYAKIWFKEEEGKLVTTLEAYLEIRDDEGEIVWDHTSSYKVETDEEELKESMKRKYEIEIPIILEKELEKLSQDNNKLLVILKNLTGGDELKKVRDFKIE